MKSPELVLDDVDRSIHRAGGRTDRERRPRCRAAIGTAGERRNTTGQPMSGKRAFTEVGWLGIIGSMGCWGTFGS